MNINLDLNLDKKNWYKIKISYDIYWSCEYMLGYCSNNF